MKLCTQVGGNLDFEGSGKFAHCCRKVSVGNAGSAEIWLYVQMLKSMLTARGFL